MKPEAIVEVVTNPITSNLIRKKARQIVRRTGFSRSDLADIEQDLRAYLLEQLPRFDPSRGTLASFVVRLVETRIRLILRDRRLICRAAGFTAVSFERLVVSRDGEQIRGEGVVSEADLHRRLSRDGRTPPEDAALRDAVAALVASLPDDIAELCRSVARDGVAATAQRRDVSRRQIEKVLRSLRERFEIEGFDKF